MAHPDPKRFGFSFSYHHEISLPTTDAPDVAALVVELQQQIDALIANHPTILPGRTLTVEVTHPHGGGTPSLQLFIGRPAYDQRTQPGTMLSLD